MINITNIYIIKPHTLLALSLSAALCSTAAQADSALRSLTGSDLIASARVKRGAYQPLARRWPDNTVFYSLDNANPATRAAFLAAARAISSQSALHFVERTHEAHYLLVATSNSFDSCGTTLGMIQGPQPLLLSPLSCFAPGEETGILLHEIMHTLGIDHEHQRVDRDTYGQVVYLHDHNQTKVNPQLSTSGPFDLDSVMMYDTQVFKPHPGIRARPWPRNTL